MTAWKAVAGKNTMVSSVGSTQPVTLGPVRPTVAYDGEAVSSWERQKRPAIVLHRWVEILERHFPPHLPDPERTTE